ncbi:MAG: CaiB/BaiF CoA-transferase family protein [Pseudomonadota bacterium]
MGPLNGFRIIELKGIGPGPYAGMLLADMGADVIVVERSARPNGLAMPSAQDVHSRGKRSIALDLKQPEGVDTLLRLIDTADGLIEGFRPGVTERLGIGPDDCLARRRQLVYGRITGWGQTGPLSQAPGHDINYIALTGSLAAIGSEDKPAVPLNLIGDYAGGSLFLVSGMLAAMLAAQKTGKGQVVDAAITDGSAHLMSGFYGWQDVGFWRARRARNLLDGAAHHYNVYETADQQFVAVGPLEPQFYTAFIELLGLDAEAFGPGQSITKWPELVTAVADVFAQETLATWQQRLEGTDACVSPVLDINAATRHPHNVERRTYIEVGGVVQPAPAPRFSETPSDAPAAPHAEGIDGDAVLADAGFGHEEIAALRERGVLG